MGDHDPQFEKPWINQLLGKVYGPRNSREIKCIKSFESNNVTKECVVCKGCLCVSLSSFRFGLIFVEGALEKWLLKREKNVGVYC